MSPQNNILPVSHYDNLEYFSKMSDDEILLRLKEAQNIWFELLVNPPFGELSDLFVEAHNNCMRFWEYSRDTLEEVARTRRLIS